MLYITGDTHNKVDRSNVSAKNMKLCCAKQNVDYAKITHLIILGDFGLPWCGCPVDDGGIHPTDADDWHLLKWYNQKPFKTLAVMGNHDNYDMIEKLPAVELFGGKVLKVSDNVFYLKRGEIYIIEEKRILVLGGARSDDKDYRIPHESWWPQEEWSEEEKATCLAKIKESGGQFDFVLSHTGTSRGIACTDSYFLNEENLAKLRKDATVCFNDEIDSMISYKKWFFGHWHSDWGYEKYLGSNCVPLFRMGIVV